MKKQKSSHQHSRGIIRDNALAALMCDPLFRCRIESNKKGKGSYQRKAKHQRDYEPSAQGSMVTPFSSGFMVILHSIPV